LYTESSDRNRDDYSKKFFIKDQVTLSAEESLFCEGILTIEECTKAIKSMELGKSLSTNCLTVDFYKLFWIKIRNLVLDSLKYAYIKGELSVDQHRGIITLIPKKR
jgi:hypothetical protein